MRIGPEEDGQSDDEEDMSVNTESGADMTDQDVMAESSQSNPQQQQTPSVQVLEPIPSSRSRASNLAAVRGLGIHVASSDASRQGQASGLPLSPRPPGRSPRSSPHPQDAAISGASGPS
jgi:RalA-binding protein 1